MTLAPGINVVTNKGQKAEFLGLVIDERDATLAVIRIEGCGMMLRLIHPSKLRIL